MTTSLAHGAPPGGTHSSKVGESTVAVPSPPRPARTVFRLYARLVRRSTIVLSVFIAGYIALGVASYRSAYPDGISPVQFEIFEDNPAIRMISGAPYALDTAAGFSLWDDGWIWQLMVAIWAILMVTRFLRADEDSDRADVLLAGPIRASRVTGLVIGVVATASVIVGLSATTGMVLMDQEVYSSLLLGLALAGVGATFAAVAAVASQLVEVRRRAAGLAAGVLAVAWIIRMIADSADPLGWLRWFTPLGWLEEMQLYGEPDPLPVIPLVLVPAALAIGAVILRSRRDTGSALLVPESGRAPRLGLLGSPLAFAWRSNRAVLLAWLLGMVTYAAIMGAILSSMIDWLAGDEGYQRILAAMGLDEAATNRGFLAFMATIFGLAVCLQVVWRMGSARAEEESGRLEPVLARPVTRLRWLGGHALLALGGGALLLLAGATAEWLGAVAAGTGDLTLWDTARGMLNHLPVVVLAGGFAVAVFGLVPRLTVVLPGALVVAAFVLSMLGPALDWPQWVLNLSPYTHLALVPALPWAAVSGSVMLGLGALFAAVGLLAFRRRDLNWG